MKKILLPLIFLFPLVLFSQDTDSLNFESIDCEDGLTAIIISMEDSYGDGWNGNEYSILNASGEVIATGGLCPYWAQCEEPELYSGSDFLCVPAGCYAISVDGGTYISETSWSVSTEYNGVSVANGGGDNVASTFALSSDDDCSALIGCTDMMANNYSDIAVADDGSCEYPSSETCEDAIAMDSTATGVYGEQVWYSISFDTPQLVTASVVVSMFYAADLSIFASCSDTALAFGALDPGTYYISVVNDNTFANGDIFDLTVNSSDVVAGCMEQYASNFNADANIDDDSCLYTCDNVWVNLDINTVNYANEVYWELVSDSGLIMAGGPYDANNTTYSVPLCLQEGSSYTMNAYDSFGDGWNGGTYSFVDTCGEDSTAFTYIAANNGGDSPSNDSTVVAGDYYLESSEIFELVSCDEANPGCMDSTAFNYSTAANITNGSCVPVIYGCTDETALNYDADANTNSPIECENYVCENGLEKIIISMEDSFGDGWNGNLYSLVNASGEVIASGGLCSGFGEDYWAQCEEPESDSGSDFLCVPAGCYAIYVDGGTYISETSWSVSTEYNGVSIANGGGDNTASTFGLSTDDDCSALIGCKNESALNFSADAIIEDGLNSCEYPTSETCEEAIAIDESASGYYGSQVWYSFSLDSSQFVTASFQGSYADYSYITVYDSCGYTPLSNSALNAGDYLISVTHPFLDSIPYDLTLNTTDIVEGCTNPLGFNYDSLANVLTHCDFLYPIEDINFLNKLKTSYSSCIVNDSLDVSVAPTINSLYLGFSDILSIDGIQYFTNLENFDCRNNDILILPELPNSLTYLDCNNNNLSILPELPSSLTELICYSNNLSSLPELPSALTYLGCSNNNLSSLTELPSTLTYLSCSSNNLTSLTELPNSLTYLSSSYNDLTILPELPSTLTYLNCSSNNLTSLTELPNSLTSLYCKSNNLISLPELPSNINTIDCSANDLISLPELPISLTYLDCGSTYNDLISLPELPSALTTLICDYNYNLTILPELPNSLTYLDSKNNNLISLTELPSSLTYLNCSNNDLTFLPELPSTLTELFCRNNDLISLPDLPDNLGDLEFEPNPIQCVNNYPVQLDYLLTEYPNCYGCTDSLAVNYIYGPIYDNGSCQFNIGVDFNYTETDYSHQISIDSNAYILIENSFPYDIENNFLIGSFFINSSNEFQSSGSLNWNDTTANIITIFEDDTTSNIINGSPSDENIIWVIQHNQTYENFFVEPVLSNNQIGVSPSEIGQETIIYFILLDEGCMDESACNYNMGAQIDDLTCYYENDIFNCEGLCNQDADLDGVCDQLEEYGCTNSYAANYNISATEDDNSCIIYGCTNELAINFDSLATDDNTSCIFSNTVFSNTQSELNQSYDNIGNLNDSINLLHNQYLQNISLISDSIDVLNSNLIIVNNYISNIQTELNITLGDLNNANISILELDSLLILSSNEIIDLQEQLAIALENVVQPIYIDLPSGWSMFGFTKQNPEDLVEATSCITDLILIAKDYNGAAYLPEFGFNGIGSLEPGFGYQIKLTDFVNDFNFCD